MERTETAETNISDAELFNSALSDEPDQEAPQTEEAPQPSEDSRQRDERGRFAPKQGEPEAQANPEPQVRDEGDDARIPAWRLAEVARERNEARQRAEEREQAWQQERQRAAALEARIAAMQPKEPPQVPDVFENPQAFVQHLQGQFQDQLTQTKANFSLQLAHMQHGERFEKGYSALMQAGQQGDSQSVQRIMQSPNPGAALMQWYSQRDMLERTGGDLDAYEKRLREELLSDPEFTKSVIEKARSGTPQGRPNVNLPPSISRMTGSSHTANIADDDDDTDGGLLRSALRR